MRKFDAARANFWHMPGMLDQFDLHLLNLAQQDGGRTADSLAESVPLSPSAIARRLRRLRGEGWIERTISLVSPRLFQNRLRAVVLIQLGEHADRAGKTRLEQRLHAVDAVQFVYEIAGPHDLIVLLDCSNMAEFNEIAEEILASTPTVRRYETHFVKRSVKFAPFVQLGAAN